MRVPINLPPAAVWFAWLMFVASFALPATGSSSAPANGWETFVSSLELVIYVPWNLAIGPSICLFILFPIFNFLMLLAPWRIAEWNAEIGAVGFLIGGSLPWLIPRDVTENFFIGFYLWDASFLLMALGWLFLSVQRNQD